MKIQVLVATMNQTDYSLVKKMNIKTDAIIGNQCDHNSVETFDTDGNRIVYLNFHEKGVGLNRNNALMRADADICLFADDDMVYDDDYSQTVKQAFLENPDADVVVFNLREKIPTRKLITRKTRVGYLNYLRYGTARVAVRLDSVKKCGIYFNQCFGGGTEHCHGEDNLFLAACLQKGLKIYAVPAYIAELTEERPSSWDTGYDAKYIKDQGVLYRTISKRWYKLLCLQDSIRRYRAYGYTSPFTVYRLMLRGRKEWEAH